MYNIVYGQRSLNHLELFGELSYEVLTVTPLMLRALDGGMWAVSGKWQH